MIENLSNTATTLVAAVILLTIIEMILPSGSIKKYVKFFGSIILMIIVVKPMINILNSDINIEKFITDNEFEMKNIEYELSEDYIYDSYSENLKQDVIKRLEENGYEVLGAELIIDKNTYEPKMLELTLKHSDGEIQPVVIGVFQEVKKELSSYDKEIVKTLINMNYGIPKSKIIINK